MGDVEFGRRLAGFRKNAGLTQKQVAISLGISNPSTVASWEGGKSEPSAATLMRLCSLYGIKDVLASFGYPSDSLSPILTPDAQRIGVAYDKAPPPTQKIVNVTLEPYIEAETPMKAPASGDMVEISEEITPDMEEAAKKAAFIKLAEELYDDEKTRETQTSAVKESGAG